MTILIFVGNHAGLFVVEIQTPMVQVQRVQTLKDQLLQRVQNLKDQLQKLAQNLMALNPMVQILRVQVQTQIVQIPKVQAQIQIVQIQRVQAG